MYVGFDNLEFVAKTQFLSEISPWIKDGIQRRHIMNCTSWFFTKDETLMMTRNSS